MASSFATTGRLRTVDPSRPLTMEEGMAIFIERSVAEVNATPIDEFRVITSVPKNAHIVDGSTHASTYAKENLKRTHFARAYRHHAAEAKRQMKEMETRIVADMSRLSRRSYTVLGPDQRTITLKTRSAHERLRKQTAPSTVSKTRLRELMTVATRLALQDMGRGVLIGRPYAAQEAMALGMDVQFKALFARHLRRLVDQEADTARARVQTETEDEHVDIMVEFSSG